MSCCCGTQTERCCECQPGPYQKSSFLHKIGGPYPDEVIMSALDRILFMWGATKISHMTAGGAWVSVSSKNLKPRTLMLMIIS